MLSQHAPIAIQRVVLMRAMLWLVDVEREKTAAATVRAAAERFGSEAGTVGALVGLKRQHSQPSGDQVEAMFEELYQAVDHLARQVDQLGTK